MGVLLDKELPDKLSYKELSVKHPDYSPDNVLEKYEALYAGGKKFRDGLEKFRFLDQRRLESSTDARPESKLYAPAVALEAAAAYQGVASQWEERKRISRYTNYVGGMFDFFAQSVFKDDPEIIGENPYWTKLKTDADGNGNTLSTVGRCGLLDALKFNRTYLSLRVPEVPGAKNRSEQRRGGGLSPVMDVLCAPDVDLWDKEGKRLAWTRTYRKDAYRTRPFGNVGQTRELWTYINDTQLIEYEIIYADDKKPTYDTLVYRKPAKLHGFERLPVIPIQISADLWAMQRLEDPALALFNREAAITWLVNSAAFQVLWIASAEVKTSVPDTAAGCLWVGQGGRAEFAGPQGGAFDAQFKDYDAKKSSMYEVFQAMGVNALSTQTQNARQSGDAKRMDKEPLYALLITFGFAMKSAFIEAAKNIAAFLEVPEPVMNWDLRGLNSMALDQKLKNLLDSQDIQGFSESARRQMLQDAALSACPDAPQGVKNDIIKESQNADLEEPESANATDGAQSTSPDFQNRMASQELEIEAA